MGWGIRKYKEHLQDIERYRAQGGGSAYDRDGESIVDGRRLMRSWFGIEADPEDIYSATEQGWQEATANFVVPGVENAKINVGYCLTEGVPSWTCKRMGVEPIRLPAEMFTPNEKCRFSYIGQEGRPVFTAGPGCNHPAHPSFAFGVYHNEPGFSVSCSMVEDGRLLSLDVFTHSDEPKRSDGTTAYIFRNPALGPDQPLPPRKMAGPSRQDLLDAAAVFRLQGKKGKDCRMFSILQRPQGLEASLLATFGNSPSFYVSEKNDGLEKTAAFFERMADSPPWAWLDPMDQRYFGSGPIVFETRRTKPLAEITAKDVPPGLDPEDVATDCQGD